MTRREKREKGMGDPRFTAGDRGRAGSGTARTLSAMVLRTSSVLILESATALTDTERLTASCERAGGRNRRRQKEGDDGVTTDGAVRRSRASRARDDSTNAAFATKRRGDVLPNDSGRPRAAGRAASRARGRIRRADVTATGPPGLKYRGSFFPRASPTFGAHLGLRDLHAVEGGGAEGAGGAGLGGRGAGREDSDGGDDGGHDYGCVVGCDFHPVAFGAFPPAGFFVERPTVAKKQNQRLFSHTKSAKHPRRSPRIGTPVVRQSQNLPTRLASCHPTGTREGPTGERRFGFGLVSQPRFAADSIGSNRSGRSVGRVGPRALLGCQTPDAHLSRGSWCVCAARAVARVGSDGRARVR